MKSLLVVMLFAVSGCHVYSDLPHEILENARCACKNSGGVDRIQIKAAYGFNRTTLDSLYNFHCKDGLETGWWLYTGTWGPQAFVPLNEDCTSDVISMD